MDFMTLETVDLQAILSTILVSVLTLWLLVRKPFGLPPGPRWRTPIFGNLREFSSHDGLKSTLKGLRETYGNIYSLFLGRRLVVIVCGRKTIQRVLRKDAPLLKTIEGFGESSLSESQKSTSADKNSIFIQSLRSILTNTPGVHEIMSHGANSMKENLEKISDHVFDSKDLIFKISSDLVCSVLLGDKLDAGIEKQNQLLHLYEQMSSLRGQQILLKLVPTLKYLPIERTKSKQLENTREKIKRIFEHVVEESKSTYENDEDSVLSAYLRVEQSGKALTDLGLCQNLVAVYLKLMRSITTLIHSAVWFLMTNRDIQTQLHTEIIRVTRQNRSTKMGAKEKLGFLDAFILETKRFVMMNSLLGYSREATCETKLFGYIIPKGTLVLADTESLMTDDSVWNEAQKFQPSRFLVDGDQGTPGLEWLEGDRPAWLDSFIDQVAAFYITSLLQHFSIEQPPGVHNEEFSKNDRFTARAIPRN